MDGTFRADTLKLKQHEDVIIQERCAAQKLCDLLSYARRWAPPEEVLVYDRLIRKAERLVRYFQAMADQVDNMSLELEKLSVDISSMLADIGR